MSTEIVSKAAEPKKPDICTDPEGHSDSVNVQDLHRTILLRENAEPHDGFEPVPTWASLGFGAVLCYGIIYMIVQTQIGGFKAQTFDRSFSWLNGAPVSGFSPAKPGDPNDTSVALGAKIFSNNCAVCHQATGLGQPGQYPPLAGSDWVVGEQASVARLSRILINGLGGNLVVNGKNYNGQMPAWGNVLKDNEIAAVLSYIRTNAEWKNTSTPVTLAEVQEARKKVGSRAGSWTMGELLAIPVDFEDVPKAAAPAPKDEDGKDAMPKKN